MPVIDFEVSDLLSLYGADIEREDLLTSLTMIGGDLDKADGDHVAIEYFPDRPDLVSVEGIARALRAFKGLAPGLPTYTLDPPGGTLTVDARVGPVRPFIVMCRVEGLGPLGDEGLKRLMDFQEKLGHGIGRRRRRVAIGIHDAARIRGPYRYATVAGDHRFHPLQAEREMSAEEVLTEHPKGALYAHLLPSGGPYPVILDADDHVLSLPPVINGTRTELTADTKDLILDLTGPDPEAIGTTMAILVTAFADRGARIVPFEVTYPAGDAFGTHAGKTTIAPDLTPRAGSVRVEETDRVLGFGLDRDGMVTALGRMGHDAKPHPDDPGHLAVLSPAWRADLLHEWDLIEDVAKGFGYTNVTDEMPRLPTFARAHPTVRRARLVRTSLVGKGFLEATTLTISSEKDQYDRFRLERPSGRDGPVVIENPITEEHTALRTWLTPSLFQVLGANRHRDYPQALFEVGQVVDPKAGHRNAWRVAAVKADPRGGFTQAKGLAEALLGDLGATGTLEEDDHPAFIAGRAARYVRSDGTVLGRFGEFHPEVLDAHEVRIPVFGMEFDLDALLPLEP